MRTVTATRNVQEPIVAPLYVDKPKQWGEIVAGVLALPLVLGLIGFLIWMMVSGGLKGLLVGGFWLLLLVPLVMQRFRSSIVQRAELVVSADTAEIWHDGALRAPIVVPAREIESIRLMRNDESGEAIAPTQDPIPYLGEDWQQANLVLAFRRPLRITQRGMWSRYKLWWDPTDRVSGFEEIDALGLDVVDPGTAAAALSNLQNQPLLDEAGHILQSSADHAAATRPVQRNPKRLEVPASPLARRAGIAFIALVCLCLASVGIYALNPSKTAETVGVLSLMLGLVAALVAIVARGLGRESAELDRTTDPVVRESRELARRARPVVLAIYLVALLGTSGPARIVVAVAGAAVLLIWLRWLSRQKPDE